MIAPGILDAAFFITLATPFSIGAGCSLATRTGKFTIEGALGSALSLVWILFFGLLIGWALERHLLSLFHGLRAAEPVVVGLLFVFVGWLVAAAIRIALMGFGFQLAKRRQARN